MEGIARLDQQQPAADVFAFRAAGADGLALSRDLWHMPLERLDRSTDLKLVDPVTRAFERPSTSSGCSKDLVTGSIDLKSVLLDNAFPPMVIGAKQPTPMSHAQRHASPK